MTTYNPAIVPCVAKCGREIDVTDRYVWSEVRGFERARDQGGTNHVAMRRPTGRWMCNSCMTKLRNDLSPGQDSLL